MRAWCGAVSRWPSASSSGSRAKVRGPMERQVVRIVTPGTVTDDALLEQRRETLLASLWQEDARADGSRRGGVRFGLAWLELASGRFSVLQIDERRGAAGRTGAAAACGDSCWPSTQAQRWPGCADRAVVVRARAPWHFELASASRLLTDQLGAIDLRGYGVDELPLAIASRGRTAAVRARHAAIGVAAYPRLACRGALGCTGAGCGHAPEPGTRREPHRQRAGNAVRGRSMPPSRPWARAPCGVRWHARFARTRMLRERYHAIATLADSGGFEPVRQELRCIGDLERIQARIALRSARPRDLVQLRASLAALPAVRGRSSRSIPRCCSGCCAISTSTPSSSLAAGRDRARARAFPARRRRHRDRTR